MVDLNNDGLLDILSGSYSRFGFSMAGLFQVLWGQPNNEFKSAEVLRGTTEMPLIIGDGAADKFGERICTRPFAVDWDSDGDLDLVVGNIEGTFHLFRGEGDGAFNPRSTPIKQGGEPLEVSGAHSDPVVVDWDGDGDLDLLSGTALGGVQWSENTAGPDAEPSLSAFAELVPAPEWDSSDQSNLVAIEDLTGPGSSTRVWVADLNTDGKMDLLVGDHVTLRSPAMGVSAEEFHEAAAEWATEMESLKQQHEDASESEQEILSYKMSNLYRSRETFADEPGTGFVWAYLQK